MLQTPLVIERFDHVIVATLNRPEALNAIDGEMSGLLGDALGDADSDPDIRAFVITGRGSKAFSAGADLKAAARGESVLAPRHPEWGFGGVTRQVVSVPLIAAVNGLAFGGGFEIVLACDLAVTAASAQFCLPEVKRGIVAAAGGATRLARRIPYKLAMEMLMVGGAIDADRALAWGLVNQIVDDGAALPAALELAERIAANAPLAVQASKRLALGIDADGELSDEQAAWERTRIERKQVMRSLDAAEGRRAFVEKRPPIWQSA